MAVPNRRLRDEREKCDLSQSELAERLSTTASNISRWERGITNPTPYFRRKLCELFQLSRDDLFRGVSNDLPTSRSEPPPFEELSAAFFFNMALSDAHECFGRIREKGDSGESYPKWCSDFSCWPTQNWQNLVITVFAPDCPGTTRVQLSHRILGFHCPTMRVSAKYRYPKLCRHLNCQVRLKLILMPH